MGSPGASTLPAAGSLREQQRVRGVALQRLVDDGDAVGAISRVVEERRGPEPGAHGVSDETVRVPLVGTAR